MVKWHRRGVALMSGSRFKNEIDGLFFGEIHVWRIECVDRRVEILLGRGSVKSSSKVGKKKRPSMKKAERNLTNQSVKLDLIVMQIASSILS